METESQGISAAVAAGLFRALPVSQNASATTGQTVNVTATTSDVNLWLTPAGTLATLTVTLPADGSTQIGQRISIGTNQAITALTINGASTIFNAASNLLIGDLIIMQKIAANTWGRV